MRRLTFILLLISSSGFTQGTEPVTSDQLQGTWWLNAVQVENFADNTTDGITSAVNSDYALEITEDSVFFRNPELRFYKRPDEGFTYSVSYDSLFKSNILHLFKGKGKHKQERGSYNFKLVNGELILNSSYEPDPNFDMLTQTTYYTYSKSKDEEHFYRKILGDWIYTQNGDFAYSENSDTLNLTKKTFPDSYSYGYPVTFSRETGETKLSYTYSYNLPEGPDGVIDGVYVDFNSNFTINPDKKQLCIGHGEKIFTFDIIELTDGKMTLVRKN